MRTHVSRTAYARYFRAERLRYLDSESAHASRCAVDQNFLPRLNVTLAKTLQGGESRPRHGARLFKRHISWLNNQSSLASTRILRKSRTTHAKHFVARLELPDVFANRFHLAGHIVA